MCAADSSAHSPRRRNDPLNPAGMEELTNWPAIRPLNWAEDISISGRDGVTGWWCAPGRWTAGRASPNFRLRKALLELAGGMGLGHLFNY